MVETQELLATASVVCAGVSVETGKLIKMPEWVISNVRECCQAQES